VTFLAGTAEQLAMWLMNGATSYQAGEFAVGNVPAARDVVGTGDYTGTARRLLWRDTSGNTAMCGS